MPDTLGTENVSALEAEVNASLDASEAASAARARWRRRMEKRVRKSFRPGEGRLKEILDQIDRDEGDRRGWMQDRRARYAKYRGWRDFPKTFPWNDCADVHLPVMMIDSQRFQDSLTNAVLASRPAISAKALQRRNKQREESIDLLLDYQFFVEQKGEEIIGLLSEKFANDGIMNVFMQWVRRRENALTVRTFPALEDDADGAAQLEAIARSEIFEGNPAVERSDKDGFEYEAVFTDALGVERKGSVEFYFRENGTVEAFVWAPVELYNGPCAIVKSIEDVIYPWRCGNPQPPSPENPHGADHVAVLDYPSMDEIARLQKDGYYDLLTDDDLREIQAKGDDNLSSSESQELKAQKDQIEGVEDSTPGDRGILTRVRYFGREDVDGDGLMEDVVYWILREKKKLLRVRHLSEEFPSDPPAKRPIMSKSFIPVGEDRIYGISLLELLESMHDVMVTSFNQAIDNGTLTNTPFFAYRPSAMTPDVIRLYPNEGIKMSNPTQDLYFPQMPNASQAFWFNLISLGQQFVEKASMQGATSFGQVPRGQASAFRNVSSMFALLRQGDARPERILRRFFSGLAEVFSYMHQMNKFFMPEEKEIRITGYKGQDSGEHATIRAENIQGDYAFDFRASVFNTSPDALEAALNRLGSILLSPIAVQFGLVTPEKAYNLLADIVKSVKLDGERYLNRPDPDVDTPKLLAEEIISAVLDGELPEAQPLEDIGIHLRKMLEFVRLPASEPVSFQKLDQTRQAMIKTHILRVRQLMAAQAEKAAQMRAAAMAQGPLMSMMEGTMMAQSQPMTGPGANPQLQQNELLDESLPGAGGGANP